MARKSKARKAARHRMGGSTHQERIAQAKANGGRSKRDRRLARGKAAPGRRGATTSAPMPGSKRSKSRSINGRLLKAA